MAASITAEYDLTGLSGQGLYDKLRAMLVASGAVIYDEYVVSSTLYLVERVSVAGYPDLYARWSVNSTNLSAPSLSQGWSVSSHSAVNLMTNPGSVTVSASMPYARLAWVSGGYRVVILAGNANVTTQTLGWMVPGAQPPGWNPSSYAYAVSGVGGTSGVPCGFWSIPNMAGAYYNTLSVAVPTLPAYMDAGTFLGAFPLVIGNDWGYVPFPADFQAITGRPSSDFTSLRDATYTLTVGGQARTYTVLSLNNNVAYVLRRS